ncbi:alpha/beta hydrolase [Primorskyibacter aestuariivivens]|uniref:alpha/beta fold hydrolase n=1 Tax=Primorskyibacter aestuariivivens TaxID=1888912 RepID=UPI002301E5D4|nr:alpha/beta hydrolase [Primorskyibacter aestuariivivens]MDA7428203.1 alpha/beta hydrolase [Primorskyibacter aestuariivivens]
MTPFEADFVEQGNGPTVILLHSSVAGARQWRGLMDRLAGTYRLIAVNLFGYGTTPPWDLRRPQSLEDQARLIESLLQGDRSRARLVGHSFGGSVAMKAATLFPERIDKLVLIEPNPFYLLAQAGRSDAYAEAEALRGCIKTTGATGDWPRAAAEFADYWTGAGSWDRMPEDRRQKFAQALKPNFHEWDAVMTPDLPLSDWHARLPRDTTVMHAADTVRSIREIVELLASGHPGWRFETFETGGHMAPLSHPDMVNAAVKKALA